MSTAIESALRTAMSAVGNAIGVKGTAADRSSPTLRRTIDNYDELGGTSSSGITDYPVTIMPVQEYSNREIDGERIIKGDVKVRLAAKGLPLVDNVELEPNVETDVLLINNVQFRIVDVGRVTGGVEPAMYVLQCRK
jgi:hypothetical protein